jgi:hypothetical protein
MRPSVSLKLLLYEALSNTGGDVQYGGRGGGGIMWQIPCIVEAARDDSAGIAP